MKTPDEIKKELERCTTYICGFPYCEGCLYGIDAEKVESDCVDALLKDALAYIQQLESAQPKWISVKEQPNPPKDGQYYCYGFWINSGKKQLGEAEYLCEEWKISNSFVLTHWMPLPSMPEPPKEDCNEQ